MNDSLKLHLHDDGDLVLPAALLSADLTPCEIIVVIGLLAMQEGHYDFANALMLDDASGAAARQLAGRGVLRVSQDAERVTITVDLEKLPTP